SQRAAEAALIRDEFRDSSLEAEIAAAAPARQLLLEDARTTLQQDFGIHEVRHIDGLRIVIAATGFTRQAPEPARAAGEVPLRLNAFTDEVTESLGGRVPIYALPVCTEGILLRFDPRRILRWAIDNLDWPAPHAKIMADPAQAHAYVL